MINSGFEKHGFYTVAQKSVSGGEVALRVSRRCVMENPRGSQRHKLKPTEQNVEYVFYACPRGYGEILRKKLTPQ